VAPSSKCLLAVVAVATIHLLIFNLLISNDMGDQDFSRTIYLPSLVTIRPVAIV